MTINHPPTPCINPQIVLRDIAALAAEAIGEAVVTAYWTADRARLRWAAWWSPDREVCRWVRETGDDDA